ncbi:MAG: hypothetical protein LCH91_25630 [Bacteroidetes bacterium]|nr:hypothetical protein [Bacteroidota bacterium]
MRTLKYGFFGEDIAQQLFLENYLLQLPLILNEQVAFVRDVDFKLKGHNKSNVIKLLSDAVQIGLSQYHQDVFFVGVDSDDERMTEHKKQYLQITEQVSLAHRDKTFIFIPVQCIEHWLLYLKFKKEHPNSNKNEKYEQIARADAKKKMYGNARPVMDKQIGIVANCTQNMDIEWLIERSESFRHFHCQLIDFLTDKDTKTSR